MKRGKRCIQRQEGKDFCVSSLYRNTKMAGITRIPIKSLAYYNCVEHTVCYFHKQN